MNRLDIEEWAYRIIDLAERAQPIEDDRLELKSHFPEPREIARQLGGHANVARGEEILWLLGVDERRGVVDVQMRDMASWRSQLEAEFEGGAPIAQQLTLEWKGKPFVALLFSTDSPPYVVRNPKRNEPGAGPFELEVPWRDGRTRSARRSELVLLLRPIARRPTVDALFGEVRVLREGRLNANVRFYVVAENLQRIVIPRATASVNLGPGEIPFPRINADPEGPDPDVIGSRSHLTINGAGRISCNGSVEVPLSLAYGQTAIFEINLRIAGMERTTGRAKLTRVQPDNDKTYALWKLSEYEGT